MLHQIAKQAGRVPAQNMKKYTAEENRVRKSVFEAQRNKMAFDEILKQFGNNDLVRSSYWESLHRTVSKIPGMSLRQLVTEKINFNKLMPLSKCLPVYHCEEKEARRITVSKFGFSGQSRFCKEYSMVEAEVKVEFDFPLSFVRRLEALSGKMTCRGKEVEKGVWECMWIEFDYTRDYFGRINSDITYHMQCGFVAKFGEEWFHSNSLELVLHTACA